MYDPSIDDWTPVPELRTNRCNAGNNTSLLRQPVLSPCDQVINTSFTVLGVCALDGKLYIVGGSDPYGQKGLKNCDVFDPVTKSWTSCAPLNIRKLVVLFCFGEQGFASIPDQLGTSCVDQAGQP